jgi:hypothetical protein
VEEKEWEERNGRRGVEGQERMETSEMDVKKKKERSRIGGD